MKRHISLKRAEDLAKHGNRSAKRALKEAKKLSQPMFLMEGNKVSVVEFKDAVKAAVAS